MIKPGPGTLLIAEPFLKDPNFMSTVVFLCDHRDEGSFGFVINRAYEHTLNELMNNLDELKFLFFTADPVQMDTIHFLHQYPPSSPAASRCWTASTGAATSKQLSTLSVTDQSTSTRYASSLATPAGAADSSTTNSKETPGSPQKHARRSVFHGNTAEIWRDSLETAGRRLRNDVQFPALTRNSIDHMYNLLA